MRKETGEPICEHIRKKNHLLVHTPFALSGQESRVHCITTRKLTRIWGHFLVNFRAAVIVRVRTDFGNSTKPHMILSEQNYTSVVFVLADSVYGQTCAHIYNVIWMKQCISATIVAMPLLQWKNWISMWSEFTEILKKDEQRDSREPSKALLTTVAVRVKKSCSSVNTVIFPLILPVDWVTTLPCDQTPWKPSDIPWLNFFDSAYAAQRLICSFICYSRRRQSDHAYNKNKQANKHMQRRYVVHVACVYSLSRCDNHFE